MGAAAQTRYEVDLHPTPEQHRLLTEAASREHRSIGSFVLDAALSAARDMPSPKPKRSPEEIKAIFARFRETVQAANVENRDILADFLADRRAESERE